MAKKTTKKSSYEQRKPVKPIHGPVRKFNLRDYAGNLIKKKK